MSVDKFESKNALVFNFDQYAGNYEREFCGFVIGATGECGVGKDMAHLYEEDHPQGTPFYALSDRTTTEADDSGCWRPVSIYHDPDVDTQMARYHSLIIFLQTIPTDDEIAMIMQRAKRFCAERPDWEDYMGEIQPLTLKGIKLISNKVERVITVEREFDFS